MPDPWKDQRTPALAIVARGDQIEAVSRVDWLVRSQSDPSKAYRVSVRRDRWICDCGHFREVSRHCIHILAVRFQNDLRATLGSTPTPERPLCDRCGSGEGRQEGVAAH